MQALFMTLLAGLLLFFGCLAGTVIGSVVGWIVGLFFDGTMLLLAQALGIEAAPYQLGAMVGFLGSFFHSPASKS